MTGQEDADRDQIGEARKSGLVDADVEWALERLVELIRLDPIRFDQVLPDDEATRAEVNVRAAAAGQLLRAGQLLEEALGCAKVGANEALPMVVRTLLEMGFATAYLAAEGPEGMRRLHAEQERQWLKLAEPMLGDDDPVVTALRQRVNELGPGISFAELARSAQVGGQRVYDQWYRLLSQVSVHGGLAAAQRYVMKVHGNQVRGRQRPQPPVLPQQALIVAGQCVVFLLKVVLQAWPLPLPPELDVIGRQLEPAMAEPERPPEETSLGPL